MAKVRVHRIDYSATAKVLAVRRDPSACEDGDVGSVQERRIGRPQFRIGWHVHAQHSAVRNTHLSF